MPTFDATDLFLRDYSGLTNEQQAAFRRAVTRFVADLPEGRFRKGLRVKGVRGNLGVFEMNWASDGRATFEFGESIRAGEPHILWRRIGTHDIFAAP